jgi:hypothetical protein
MLKKICTPVIDECRLEQMLQMVSGIDDLEITHSGQIVIPEGSSFESQMKVLHSLVGAERASQTRFRFLLGNYINALCHKHGDKTHVIRSEFNRHEYDRIRTYAWVAHAWASYPGLTWGWSFYRFAASATPENKAKYLAKWQLGNYSIDDLKADRALETSVKPADPETDIADADLCKLHKCDEEDPCATYPLTPVKYIAQGGLYAQVNQGVLELLTFDEERVGTVGVDAIPTMFGYSCSTATPTQWQQCELLFEAERERRKKG